MIPFWWKPTWWHPCLLPIDWSHTIGKQVEWILILSTLPQWRNKSVQVHYYQTLAWLLTILLASIRLDGKTFQLNRTPSRSSAWLMKSWKVSVAIIKSSLSSCRRRKPTRPSNARACRPTLSKARKNGAAQRVALGWMTGKEIQPKSGVL